MSSPSPAGSGKPLKCPICGKPAVEAYRPFCSRHCADIDLGRWFSGSYRVSGRADDDDTGELPQRPNEPSEEGEN
ncbi:DNA gyrase inhibitor YacG [Hyphomicrobium methylovorum]|uniref:DNA gyrase inhibitor YacG n=1 Tax=Hyphomicrobium methylovorum TaxID=84 RepID=UPI0015E6F518|nr:DNA gyrase inhibitor YacG [Hyphomicrobium methylovorum]